ncbi:MAG: sulfite exporter TauE/SafE family protein, partial [Alphaproteobacteria bacterium]|nr:sulfite exporter TauE/SafE family protein [Alphaproteobacteria bacterium]
SAHIAVATSLAAIMPAAVVSSVAHWRAGNTDFVFFREWGPGIVIGVIAAQLVAPHLGGSVLTGLFALFCLGVSIRFAAPNRFRPLRSEPPDGRFCHIAGVGIGLISGFAGVGGGILTNIVMTFCGMPMHKSIGRAAAAGVVVSIPATIVVVLAPGLISGSQTHGINWSIWLCIAPAQAAAAWAGAQLAQRIAGDQLSRIFAGVLAITGIVMLRSSFTL